MFGKVFTRLKNAIFGGDPPPNKAINWNSSSEVSSTSSPYIRPKNEVSDKRQEVNKKQNIIYFSPEKTCLRGIVHKMDVPTQRALVRVMIDQDQCHAMNIPSSKYKAVDVKHLYIPFKSIGTGDATYIELGSVVQILEYNGKRLSIALNEANNFSSEAPAEITKYSVEFSFTTRAPNELVALTSIENNYLTVVGSAYGSSEGIIELPRNVNRNNWLQLERHTFLYGELTYLPKYYKVVLKDNTPELVFDHEARLAAIKLYENSRNGVSSMRSAPAVVTTGPPFITKIRELTKLEMDTIIQQTRNLESISYADAVRYIRDPLLTCAALEDFVVRQSVKQFSCQVTNIHFDWDKNLRKYCIYVPLTESVNKCLTDRGRDTWQLGSDLVLSSPFLGRYGLPVVLEKTKYESRGVTCIRLLGGPGSDHICNAIYCHNGSINWSSRDFRLGPMNTDSNSNADAIRAGFEKFYKEQNHLFEAFVGRAPAPNMKNIPKLNEEFYIGDQKMDESQRLAMRTAVGMPGFTCVSAPPGSGKTFMISGIVGAKLQEKQKPRFAICATTNIAVTNAIEAVESNFTNERKIRQFSKKADAELGKDTPIAKISLKRMTRDVGIIRSLKSSPDFGKALARRDEAQMNMKTQAKNVTEQLELVSEYQRSESVVDGIFIRCYAPKIFGSTASIMARNNHEDITHLIIDEATQMSQVDALSLYCRFPDLQHITLIGDSRQLGPFTGLEEGSLAYQIMHKGELTRLEELKSSAKREQQFIYRSHPRIIDLLLKPIYGNQLKAGTPASKRNLAAERGLPVAKDGSPVLFVQVDGQEQQGRNPKEAEVVLNFLIMFKSKGIQPEEVNIICHHRAQKDVLCEALKDKGNIGRLNLMYGVNTVDSYQGKEAKVVLILTTKTCETRKLEILQKTFSFISDANRETVAVSRAQHAIYIFGNWKQLAIMPFWNQFGQGLIKSGAIVNQEWKPIPDAGWTKIKTTNSRRENKVPAILGKPVNKQNTKKRAPKQQKAAN